jgi:predicted metal-dependent HD superfamily phosphohydrolase
LEFSKSSSLSEKDIERVSNFILATKSHLSCESTDKDLLLFLDFDLLVLGSSKEEYVRFPFSNATIRWNTQAIS